MNDEMMTGKQRLKQSDRLLVQLQFGSDSVISLTTFTLNAELYNSMCSFQAA